MTSLIKLSAKERAALRKNAEQAEADASGGTARRAQVILLLDEGQSWSKIIEQLGCSRGFIDMWSRRFAENRLEGLFSKPRGGADSEEDEAIEQTILAATQGPPPNGQSRWSTRALGQHLGISHMKIQRVWQRHGLTPARDESATPVEESHGVPKPAPPGRHHSIVRERILREAAAAMRRHGVQGVAIADILPNAGVSNSSFYTHFKSKEQLVSHAIGYMFDQRYGTFISYVNLNPDKAEKALRGFIHEYLSPGHRDSPESGCPMPVMGPELPRLPTLARQQFGFGVDRLVAGISELLSRMGVSRPAARARSTLSELVGALTLSRAMADGEDALEFLTTSRAAIEARMTLPG